MTNAPASRARANASSIAAISPVVPRRRVRSDHESSLHVDHDQALHRFHLR
jgi:hypothetical protein